ncbi:Uncharacterised protein [uncultured archaeon]|nr:Uncharacterised protein [uncultured archaeon]
MVITLLSCVALCFGVTAVNTPVKLGLNEVQSGLAGVNAPVANNSPAANPPAKAAAAPAQVPQESVTVLEQDSGTNLTKMNITFTISPTYGSAQAVRFTPPKSGWNLENILVMATDGWNATSKEQPKPLPFTIEIRDANFTLLYHYEGIQLPYFTNSNGVRMATIDVPSIPMKEDFFVCFYGYGSVSLATELQNATGNSYYYDERTSQLFRGVLPLRNNQTIPVNWLIRVAGQ